MTNSKTDSYGLRDELEWALIEFGVATVKNLGFPSDPEQFYEHQRPSTYDEVVNDLMDLIKLYQEAATLSGQIDAFQRVRSKGITSGWLEDKIKVLKIREEKNRKATENM